MEWKNLMLLIAPFSRPLHNGQPNPKNFPYWKEVISKLKGQVIQVGVGGEPQLVEDFRTGLSLDDLGKLVDTCDTWLSVDTFFQHFCWDRKKPGIVIWSCSDPLIYGHPENINLLKDRSHLTDNQFMMWENVPFAEERFVNAQTVLHHVAIMAPQHAHLELRGPDF
jgi:hypothetical protein